MDIKENKNFISVKLYQKNVHINEILKQKHSLHLDKEKIKRYKKALFFNRLKDGTQAKIDITFLVDKGHKNGSELHCISHKGIIFILNAKKYEEHKNCLITVLLPRPNQVERLYKSINKTPPEHIIFFCKLNILHNVNN